MSDDEDDDEEECGKEEHEKEAIAEEIFQDGDGEEGQEALEAPMAPPEEEEEDDEESGMCLRRGSPCFGECWDFPAPRKRGENHFSATVPQHLTQRASHLFSLATHIAGIKAI